MSETINVHRSIVADFEISTMVGNSYFETRVLFRDASLTEDIPFALLDRVEAHLSRVMPTRADIQRYGESDMAIRTTSFDAARDTHDIVVSSVNAFAREYERVITYVKRASDED